MEYQSKITNLSLIIGLFLFVSCSGPEKDKSGKVVNSPNTGNCTIGVDETLQPIANDLLQVFSSKYTKTKIHFVYGNEQFLNNIMANDSISAIISPSEMPNNLKEYFQKRKISPKSAFIARDAIAFIGNNSLKDSELTWQNMESIFTGKAKDWKEIYGSKSGKIDVVFSANGSSTINQLSNLFLKDKKAPTNFFAIDTTTRETKENGNPKVIEYVKTHENAIGVIGVNWISNPLLSSVQSFRQEVRTFSIYPADSMVGKGRAYKPYQAYIALKGYPFIRKIYIHNREGRNGLASGFASFAAGPIGQKIILKSGLLPATAPIRIIEVKK